MSSSGGGSSPALIVTCLLVLAGSVGLMVYSDRTAPSTTQKLQVEGEGGLPCSEIRLNRPTAECIVPTGEFDALDARSLEERATATKSALEAMGATRLLVRTEDGNLRASF